jgi:hypothetical protein
MQLGSHTYKCVWNLVVFFYCVLLSLILTTFLEFDYYISDILQSLVSLSRDMSVKGHIITPPTHIKKPQMQARKSKQALEEIIPQARNSESNGVLRPHYINARRAQFNKANSYIALEQMTAKNEGRKLYVCGLRHASA